MSTIQTIFQRFGPSWLALHPRTPIQLRRTIEAIIACRSAEMGSVCYDCQDCHCRHRIPASCGNRHCPQCQGRKAFEWLQRQVERQLPGPHFMLTFTVPEGLRAFLMGQPRFGYDGLFRASADAMKALVADPRHLGAEHPGFFGVLHTWGRQLQYHPHIHYVVPAGALRQDGRWQSSQNAFFLPVRALSRLVRGKFRALVQQAELIGQVPAEVWQQEWNVHCQAMPSAEATLRYLAPYVFKVAISDQRVLKLDGDQVHIRWRKVGSTRPRVLVLHAHEFIRRFLQHVLAEGIHEGALFRVPGAQQQDQARSGRTGYPSGVCLRTACQAETPTGAALASVPPMRWAVAFPRPPSRRPDVSCAGDGTTWTMSASNTSGAQVLCEARAADTLGQRPGNHAKRGCTPSNIETQ